MKKEMEDFKGLRTRISSEKLKAIVEMGRPHQYVKNLFLFAPLFFSFQLSLNNFLKCFIGFLIFSFLASSIYIFNDILDIEEDKQHPKKKLRPPARSAILKKTAIFTSCLLSIFSLFVGFLFQYNFF